MRATPRNPRQTCERPPSKPKRPPNPTRVAKQRRASASAARHGLARALSKLGVCSRTQAAEYVRAGRVAVNGRIVRDPELPTIARATASRSTAAEVHAAERIYLMLNKPRGLGDHRARRAGPRDGLRLFSTAPACRGRAGRSPRQGQRRPAAVHQRPRVGRAHHRRRRRSSTRPTTCRSIGSGRRAACALVLGVDDRRRVLCARSPRACCATATGTHGWRSCWTKAATGRSAACWRRWNRVLRGARRDRPARARRARQRPVPFPYGFGSRGIREIIFYSQMALCAVLESPGPPASDGPARHRACPRTQRLRHAASTDDAMKTVLMFPYANHLGGTQPLVAIAHALRESGHNVVFAARGKCRTYVEECGFEVEDVIELDPEERRVHQQVEPGLPHARKHRRVRRAGKRADPRSTMPTPSSTCTVRH